MRTCRQYEITDEIPVAALLITTTVGRSVYSVEAPGKQVMIGLYDGTHCACSYELDPQCGIDGITYINRCSLDCTFGGGLSHHGTCELFGGYFQDSTGGEPCGCGPEYFPVCDKNGHTFLNRCVLQCQEKDFAYEGYCEEKKRH